MKIVKVESPPSQKSYCNVVSCHKETDNKPFCQEHYLAMPPASKQSLKRLYDARRTVNDARRTVQSAFYQQTAITIAKNLDIHLESRRFASLRRSGYTSTEAHKVILAERQEHRVSKAILLNPALAETLRPAVSEAESK